MKVILLMVIEQEQENIDIMMAIIIMVNERKIKDKVKEN